MGQDQSWERPAVREARSAWQAFEAQAGTRYTLYGVGFYGVVLKRKLVAADGSVAATLTRLGLRSYAVTIGDVRAYETHPCGWRNERTQVTDASTGEPIATITGSDRFVGTEFRFEGGRTVQLPVYEARERAIRVSKNWLRRFGVMYAVDDIGTLLMVRLDTLWLASLVTRPEVVVCGDVSREKLLLALLAAPLLQRYLTTVSFEG